MSASFAVNGISLFLFYFDCFIGPIYVLIS